MSDSKTGCFVKFLDICMQPFIVCVFFFLFLDTVNPSLECYCGDLSVHRDKANTDHPLALPFLYACVIDLEIAPSLPWPQKADNFTS